MNILSEINNLDLLTKILIIAYVYWVMRLIIEVLYRIVLRWIEK